MRHLYRLMIMFCLMMSSRSVYADKDNEIDCEDAPISISCLNNRCLLDYRCVPKESPEERKREVCRRYAKCENIPFAGTELPVGKRRFLALKSAIEKGACYKFTSCNPPTAHPNYHNISVTAQPAEPTHAERRQRPSILRFADWIWGTIRKSIF